MANTNTNTNTDSDTGTNDTGTAPRNRERYPRAQTSDNTDDRSPETTDDFGTLIARAGHAAGSALWLAVQAVFVGLTAVVAVVRDEDSRLRTQRWLLLEGDRWTIIGVATVGVFLGTVLLGTAGIVGVRESSFVTQLFATLTAGIISFTGIVISINQLVVSRLFGTPETAREEIDDVRQFRKKIAERTPEREVLPTEPSAFMAVVVDLLFADVRHLREATGETGNTELNHAIEEYTRIVTEQSEALSNRLHEGQVPLFEMLLVMLNDSYSEYVNIARRIQARYADSLSETATDRLADLRELFGSLTVTRQYFKVLYLHQVFGRLSRQLVYTGLGAFLTAILVVLVFSTGYAPLGSGFVILIFVSLALAVTVLPLIVFSVYMLRIATIIKRSSSPGPFTPEGQKPEYAEYRGGLDQFSDHDESPHWRRP
jgi:hypothetical protein